MAVVADPSRLKWIRLTFVDVFGTCNAVQLPAARWDAALGAGQPFDGSALEGRIRLLESDMLLVPDPATLVDRGDGTGRAVCAVRTFTGEPWGGDPRTGLADILDACGDLAPAYHAATELEFYLLDEAGEALDRAGYFDDAEGKGMRLVREAAGRLEGYGVEVTAAHHEVGPGQYEIDLAPLPALQLADALVLAKETIREAARDAGLRATFMPQPLAGQAGSGLHLHQHVAGHAVVEGGRLDPEIARFVAGQLEHAMALCAFAAPTVNSYKRLHSGPEAPSAVVWAHANRSALIRVSPHAAGSIEYRGADPAANPYLLLGGLLVAGADGMERGLDLVGAVEEEIGVFDPAADTSFFEPLPRDLDGALDALLSDDVLVDAFDARLLSRLVDGRRAETLRYRSHVTSWEREEYLDTI